MIALRIMERFLHIPILITTKGGNMAPIRRAHRYFIYLAALLISGFFSLLGRPAPSWAQEVKSEHSAKVFNEMFQVAQALGPVLREGRARPGVGVERGTHVHPPGEERGVFPTGPFKPGEERGVFPTGPFKPGEESAISTANQQVNEALESINLKLKNPRETLTPDEYGLLIGVQNAAALDELSNQLKILVIMVKDLQGKGQKQ